MLVLEPPCTELGYQNTVVLQQDLDEIDYLIVIPWFIEDVVLMTSHAFTSELSRES